MNDAGLWKYCTKEQCQEFLLSLKLLPQAQWPESQQLACLYAVSNHVEAHYQTLSIPKRDGTKRVLHVPDALLKGIQTKLYHHVLKNRPISPHATAYHSGADIRANASPHVGKALVLKMDIADFFDSITFPMVYRSAFPATVYPPAVGTLLTHLCCYRELLPQGAPTSPAISNLVMLPFDQHMGEWCGERGIAYTRYCDDMTFSGDFDPTSVKHKTQHFLEELGFSLNPSKTSVVSRHQRQTVTGLVVNQKPAIPRPWRKKLRQEVYYCRKRGVAGHLEWLRSRDPQTASPEIPAYLLSLQGKLRYALHIHPNDAYLRQAKADVDAWVGDSSVNNSG